MKFLTTQKLKGKIIKIRTPSQVVVPLELRNDFNDNSDNNDKYDNNDDGANNSVNRHSMNPRGDLNNLLDKTDLRRYNTVKTCG